jgi:hypothetical protein
MFPCLNGQLAMGWEPPMDAGDAQYMQRAFAQPPIDAGLESRKPGLLASVAPGLAQMVRHGRYGIQ